MQISDIFPLNADIFPDWMFSPAKATDILLTTDIFESNIDSDIYEQPLQNKEVLFINLETNRFSSDMNNINSIVDATEHFSNVKEINKKN